MSLIIEVKDLIMQYPAAAEPAVRDMSFGVLQGEIFGLLGPNGAGKTTILSILAGELEPSRGEVLIAGHSLRLDLLAVRRATGMMPQDTAINPGLRAREHLSLWGRRYGLGGGELKRRIDEGLEVVGLRGSADERVGQYSRAMKRRLNIAAALLHQPQVLLMDEPTLGLDAQSRRSLWNLVGSLKAQGLTVLHTTCDAEEAQGPSDRIGLVDRGRLRALGTGDELISLGVAVTDASGRKPGLEAAFWQLTGRTLGNNRREPEG